MGSKARKKYKLGSKHPTLDLYRVVALRDILREEINIGCKTFSIKYWLENYKEIGRKEGYSKEEIRLYGKLIKLQPKWVAATGKGEPEDE